jgi:hypothetical protein
MKGRIIALCALVAGLAAMARAQAPGSFSVKCNPKVVNQEISSTWDVGTFTCTTDAAISGVPFKGLMVSATSQYAPAETNVWGVFVGTLANNDQVFFEYHVVAPAKNGVVGIGTMTYKIVGGTGIANGITGSGTCKAAPIAGGGTEDACVGAYATR